LSDWVKEKEEKIQHIIAKLAEESAEGKPIVVEGKKDAQTLKELGINGRIVTIKTGGKSFLQATEEIEQLGAREVILLLDFDRRGKEGTMRLKHNLERVKVKVNTRYWKELHAFVGREIQCIESLTSYLITIKQKIA
jgi:2,5-diamino-6-(ribosylamino)-4(3H)-pyrimidinone 5'-phosphate reductase